MVRDKRSINASLYFAWRSENRRLHTTIRGWPDARFIGWWSLLRHDDKGTHRARDFPTLKSLRLSAGIIRAQIKRYVWHRTRRLLPSRPGKISPPLSASRAGSSSNRSNWFADLGQVAANNIICPATLNGINLNIRTVVRGVVKNKDKKIASPIAQRRNYCERTFQKVHNL